MSYQRPYVTPVKTDSGSHSPALAAYIILALACVAAFVPLAGFAVWIIAAPLLLITFILGIVALSKGGTAHGVFILFASLIICPSIIVVAPIAGTMLGFAAPAAAAGAVGAANTDANAPTAPATTTEIDPAPGSIDSGGTTRDEPTVSPFPTAPRTWTAKDGRTMQAAAIDYDPGTGKVEFQRADGKFFDYNVNNLSPADQKLLDDLALKATMGSR